MNRGQKITLVKEAATEPQNRIIKKFNLFLLRRCSSSKSDTTTCRPLPFS